MRRRQRVDKKPSKDPLDKSASEGQSSISQLPPEVLDSGSVVCPSNPEVVVLRDRWGEPILACLLFLALALPTIAIVAVVVCEWHDRPTQRGWLILGFAFYIFTALKAVWAMFLRVCEQL